MKKGIKNHLTISSIHCMKWPRIIAIVQFDACTRLWAGWDSQFKCNEMNQVLGSISGCPSPHPHPRACECVIDQKK